jgi:hypothetical protein
MYYEIDIIEYGGVEQVEVKKEKTHIFMALATNAYNEYPRYMMFHVMPNHKANPIKEFISSHMVLLSNTIVSCDNDPSFKWLKDVSFFVLELSQLRS